MVGLIQTYLDHLTVERGLSRHTVGAYGRDLRRYAGYLAEVGITDPVPGNQRDDRQLRGPVA